jgi:hypothetical protein
VPRREDELTFMNQGKLIRTKAPAHDPYVKRRPTHGESEKSVSKDGGTVVAVALSARGRAP